MLRVSAQRRLRTLLRARENGTGDGQVRTQSDRVIVTFRGWARSGTLRCTRSESVRVARIRFQPSGENVSALKTRGESSGFVNACEKASIATIRPMSGGSGAAGRPVLPFQPPERT